VKLAKTYRRGGCGDTGRGHRRRMARLNARHLDQRRQLVPRDYAAVPELFGVDPRAEFWVPAEGDEPSMRVAREQHLLLCIWNVRRRPSADVLANRFGTSKQTISRVSRGERWAGETLFAALVFAIRCSGPQPRA